MILNLAKVKPTMHVIGNHRVFGCAFGEPDRQSGQPRIHQLMRDLVDQRAIRVTTALKDGAASRRTLMLRLSRGTRIRLSALL